jgi:phosphate transport system ATP-binding protein
MVPTNDVAITVERLDAWYGTQQALHHIDLHIPKRSITAFIGSSGCGKSTLLRSINRLNDLVPGYRLKGTITVDGLDIYRLRKGRAVNELRKRVAMVFQQPDPLPTTIMRNMTLPLLESKHISVRAVRERAVELLARVGLLEEVKDKLNSSALALSGGQQQRLCIARALMLDPPVLLLDEPCSALDPISTALIEEVLLELKRHYTIVLVTHNLEQARRISDTMALFCLGRMVESGATAELVANPRTELLRNYLAGRETEVTEGYFA